MENQFAKELVTRTELKSHADGSQLNAEQILAAINTRAI